MKEPMRAYLRLGTIHHVSYPYAGGDEAAKLDTLKKLLCDDAFDAIELGHFADPGVRRKAIDMIRCAAVDAVAYGGQGLTLSAGLNVNHLDEGERRKAVAALKAGIDEAYEFGARHFAFLAGRYEQSTMEASFAALVESTRELCAYAAARGDMTVEIEVFDFDLDKKSLIGPADRVLRLAEAVAPECPNFAVQVDSSHFPQIRETDEESILPVRPWIRHVHIGNAVVRDPSLPAYGDMHPRFGFPGSENGAPELARTLRVLLDSGFLNERDRPILSFEVKPQPGEDPDLVLANAKRTLHEAWLLA